MPSPEERHFASATDSASDRAELDAARRELAGFTYAVSHDLSAPLRAIDGFSEALEEDYADRLDEQGRDYLARIRAAAARMEQQIHGLLELSRVSQAALRPERIDVTESARAIARRLQSSDATRQVEFRIEPGLEVQADPVLFPAVLEHLLSNSWKFTGKKPTAVIAVGREVKDGRAMLYVRDDGAGFDPASAGRMFDAFQRLHSAAEFEGLGIGLAVVQRIINRHGGTVSAVGVPGCGTTIHIDLT